METGNKEMEADGRHEQELESGRSRHAIISVKKVGTSCLSPCLVTVFSHVYGVFTLWLMQARIFWNSLEV
jgi:hypothetical protein